MAFYFLDGEQIQEGLCRMFMRAVTTVNNDRRYAFAGKKGRAFLLMAHNDGIDAHGRNGKERIAEAFSLLNRTAARRKVNDVGTQVFSCHFKGAARTRTWFPKHVDNGFSLQ